mgnify:CR=1 FL=1
MTRTALAAAVFMATFLMSEATAQPVCNAYAVIKNMVERQAERLGFRGISESGSHLLEVFLDSREGSARGFTVVITRAVPSAETQTCVVFSGFGWENVQGDTPWRTPKGEPS